MQKSKLTTEYKTFFDFCQSAKGMIVYYNGKYISKAAAYWGVLAGRIEPKQLKIINKPGWEGGCLTNYVHYTLWLNSAKL
jgi:hypothetical protein